MAVSPNREKSCRDHLSVYPAQGITFRIPVTIEQIERTNRWLEKKIDAKIDAALRLHQRSIGKRLRPINMPPDMLP